MLLVDMGCRPLFYIVGSGLRVTTFLEFLETWKCPGIWLRSPKRRKVEERSGNLCSRGNLIVAAQQNAGDQTVVWTVHELWCAWTRYRHVTYLYFIRTAIYFSNMWRSRRIRISRFAFVRHIASNFILKSQGKVGDYFSVWRVFCSASSFFLHPPSTCIMLCTSLLLRVFFSAFFAASSKVVVLLCRCKLKITGDVIVSFPAGVVQTLRNNPWSTALSLHVKNLSLVGEILTNKQLISE